MSTNWMLFTLIVLVLSLVLIRLTGPVPIARFVFYGVAIVASVVIARWLVWWVIA